MKEQSYSNHKRYYIPHHFVFYPVVLALMAAGVRFAMKNPEQRELWIFMIIVLGLIAWLSFMLRQHYAMALQDRIIINELRYRYYVLTNERFEPLEGKLSKGQLFALRFASDGELPALVKRTVNEGLSPDAIKQAVQHWKADNGRV